MGGGEEGGGGVKSGREDLNLRPRRPERRALTKLRYAPINLYYKADLTSGARILKEVVYQGKLEGAKPLQKQSSPSPLKEEVLGRVEERRSPFREQRDEPLL